MLYMMSTLWFMRQTSQFVLSAAQRGVHTSALAAAGEFLSNPAFNPTKAGDVWRKASVSPKNVARLMKEQGISKSAEKAAARAERAPATRPPKPPKGHKVDRLKVALVAEREAKLAAMDTRVAEYRKKKREAVLGQTSALDRLVMTKRQLRLKARNAQV